MEIIPRAASIPAVRTALIALAAGLFMAGCAKPSPRQSHYEPDETVAGSFYKTMVYACDGGLRGTARFDGDTLRLKVGEESFRLPQEGAASGARYSDTSVTFWIRGSEAHLEKASLPPRACRYDSAATMWEQAWARGVTLRATGAEIEERGKVDWTLELTSGKNVVFVTNNGNLRAAFPDTLQGKARGTGIESVAHRFYGTPPMMVVEWDHRPCREGGSGEPLDLSVKVEYAGRKYQGCGRTGP